MEGVSRRHVANLSKKIHNCIHKGLPTSSTRGFAKYWYFKGHPKRILGLYSC